MNPLFSKKTERMTRKTDGCEVMTAGKKRGRDAHRTS